MKNGSNIIAKDNIDNDHIPKNKNRKVCIILFTLLFVLTFTPKMLMRTRLGSDDASYVSHAFTIALDGDLDYTNETFYTWNKNRTIAGHGIGSGAMASVFVFPMSLLDRLWDHPVIKNHKDFYGSWSFFGFLLAANLYFLFAIYIYWKTFKLIWLEMDKLWLVPLLVFSSGVPHYVLMRFTMAHAFEIFAGSLTLYSSVRLYYEIKKSSSVPIIWHLLCGICFCMSLFIRYFSYHLVLFSPLVLLLMYMFETNSEKSLLERKFYLNILILLSLLIIGWLPKALFNLNYFDSVFPSFTAIYGHNAPGVTAATVFEKIATIMSRIPKILLILFSSEWGVIYTNPILPIGGFSLLIMSVKSAITNKTAIGVIVALVLLVFYGYNVSIILWGLHAGMGYGYRHLLSVFSMSMLGVLFFLRYVERFNSKMVLRCSYYAVITLCIISVLSMMCYGATSKLWAKRQVNVFGELANSSGRGYVISLFGEIVKPGLWKNLISKRYAGFTGKKILLETNCRYLRPKVSMKQEVAIRNIPKSIYIQSSFLFLIWILFGICFGRRTIFKSVKM